MKILHINSVYKNGSTGRIVYNIHHELLNKGIDSFVCFGRGKNTYDEIDVQKTSSEFEAVIHSFLARLFGGEYRYSHFSTKRVLRIISKYKPDIVQIHCLNCHYINAYKLLNYLKKNNIKTLLTLHAEIMHTAGCEHAFDCNKWKCSGCEKCQVNRGLISGLFRDDAKKNFELLKRSIDGFSNLFIIGVSNFISSRARESIIFHNKPVFTITNGIDKSIFKYTPNPLLKDRFKDYKKVILHVTPNFELDIKGGHYIEELACMLPNYAFVVVGSKKVSNLKNLFFIEHTKDQKELAEYYSIADCFAMTSKRETYPTVCLEAVACGCNVVGFDTGGVKETIPSGMGECVEPYDLNLFCKAIIKWSNIDNHTQNHHVKDKKEFVNDYLSLYEKLLREGGSNGKQ